MLFNLRLIPLLPFAGAALLILFGRFFRRPWVHLFATLAIASSCLVCLEAFFAHLPANGEHGLKDTLWTWMSSGDLRVDLTLRMDRLSGLLCLVITFIGTLIHIYSTGYMSHDEDYARFFAYLNLFCGAMLVLVLGDSLPVMFIGWEGVGLCSYLLIGFWYGEKANADAGKKAFITNRVGDFGFLLGMFLLFYATGSFNIPDILHAAKDGAGGVLGATLWLGQPVAFWAALFLFIGATGKSAQIPLYVWLPDAMAGPTPVSALIHAATMVTAGVYMVARLGAVYAISPAALAIVAIVGALTALFAAIIGFAQNDFKKVLAYSTVSQLGFMFAGVGTGAYGAGVFHLFTHAFFKAGLFLCAGSVMHAMSGSGDITKMGGLRKKLPWTHGVFLVCWLAICGVPGFSGFFSKDAIVASAFGTDKFGPGLAWVGPVVGVALLLAALGTAFYMSRLYFLVFTGESRADEKTKAHIHESPVEMVGPLVVLAVGAAIGGFIGLPGALVGKPELNLLGEWLEPAIGPELAIEHGLEIGIMGASTVAALLGIFLARAFFGGGYRAPAHSFANAVPGFVQLVRDKFRVDEGYAWLIGGFRRWFADVVVFKFIDRIVIDNILVRGVGFLVEVGGRIARVFQAGDVQRYLAVFAIGALAIFYGAVKPPSPEDFVVQVDGAKVHVDASKGMPSRKLDYEFDFDQDGARDRWAGPVADWTYEGTGTYMIRLKIRDPRWGFETTVDRKVRIK
jgi:NADH-quinone oxidoreductase subunit L